jgi:ribonuclease HII
MSDSLILGVDEAGRGALAGPVVAAAVWFTEGFSHPYLKDSKALSAEQRNDVYHALMEAGVGIGVGIVNHIIIDKINILQATLLAMKRAILSFDRQDFNVIIDGNKAPYLPDYSITTLVKGDSKIAEISAASIVAKVTRDSIMQRLDCAYPGYGFSVHKGYGTEAHMEHIWAKGRTDVHRKSFNISRQESLF